MTKQSHLSDIEFISKIEDGSFAPESFDHEAHLRLAWINITLYGIDEAIRKVQGQLKGFVAQVGAKEKYNETLTIAAVKVVYHFILKSKSNTFKDFSKEFPRLHSSFTELIDTHYGFDIFNSAEAKTRFLEPDLLPFD